MPRRTRGGLANTAWAMARLLADYEATKSLLDDDGYHPENRPFCPKGNSSIPIIPCFRCELAVRFRESTYSISGFRFGYLEDHPN